MASARHPLRGLVTCAGVTAVGKSIDFSMEHAQDIININTIGTFVCAQAAARIVLKQKVGANFVFIASMSGYIVNKVSVIRTLGVAFNMFCWQWSVRSQEACLR